MLKYKGLFVSFEEVFGLTGSMIVPTGVPDKEIILAFRDATTFITAEVDRKNTLIDIQMAMEIFMAFNITEGTVCLHVYGDWKYAVLIHKDVQRKIVFAP